MFLSDEDPKLKENIKTVEQLSENLNDTHQCAHTNMQSEKKKNVKNQDKLQDVFEDPELRVLRSKKCDLEESKKVLEDKCNALSSVKTMKEAELKQLKKKVDTLVEFYEQKRMAAADVSESRPVPEKNSSTIAKKNPEMAKVENGKNHALPGTLCYVLWEDLSVYREVIVSDLKTSLNSNNLVVQRAYLEKVSDLPKA
ncbi:hypothetical protein VULLAG_LOCUS11673 [Vulpes lagopus]